MFDFGWNSCTWYLFSVSRLFNLETLALCTQISHRWSTALLTSVDSTVIYQSPRRITDSFLAAPVFKWCTHMRVRGEDVLIYDSVKAFYAALSSFHRLRSLEICRNKNAFYCTLRENALQRIQELSVCHVFLNSSAFRGLLLGFGHLRILRLNNCYNYWENLLGGEGTLTRLIRLGLEHLEIIQCSGCHVREALSLTTHCSKLTVFHYESGWYDDLQSRLTDHVNLTELKLPLLTTEPLLGNFPNLSTLYLGSLSNREFLFENISKFPKLRNIYFTSTLAEELDNWSLQFPQLQIRIAATEASRCGHFMSAEEIHAKYYFAQ